VLAIAFDRRAAEQIISEHNKGYPIKSWNDWLEYRCGRDDSANWQAER
jgi:hypothetical protein